MQTSYQYAFEHREKVEDTMKLAQFEFRKSQFCFKHYYDKKAKQTFFKEGDKSLNYAVYQKQQTVDTMEGTG